MEIQRGDEDAARRWLREHGATEAQLEAVAGQDELNQLAADLALARDAHLSARDMAERLGAQVQRVLEGLRLHGVIVRDVDAPLFTDADLVMCELSETTGILDSADGQVLSRVIATALDSVADAAVALYVQGSGEEMRRQASPLAYVQKTSHMIDLAGKLGSSMGVLFRHHMRQAIHRQRVTQAGVASRDLARIAIGFVDLVGSTAFGESVDVTELRKLVAEFEARAFEVAAEHGGRVVKFIGDEIMVAALDPVSGCRLMLALVDACGTAGMQPRGGLAYGEVLFRGGDYYGSEVNLAARLVDTAIPGEVLVASSVVDAVLPSVPDATHPDPLGTPGTAGAAEDAVDAAGVHVRSGGTIDPGSTAGAAAPGAHSLRFEPAGRRLLKGFADPIRVWSVTTEDRLGG